MYNGWVHRKAWQGHFLLTIYLSFFPSSSYSVTADNTINSFGRSCYKGNEWNWKRRPGYHLLEYRDSLVWMETDMLLSGAERTVPLSYLLERFEKASRLVSDSKLLANGTNLMSQRLIIMGGLHEKPSFVSKMIKKCVCPPKHTRGYTDWSYTLTLPLHAPILNKLHVSGKFTRRVIGEFFLKVHRIKN